MRWTKLMTWVVTALMVGSVLSVSAQASQVRDYWFDSCSWDGTSGEVLDHSGNGYDGFAVDGAQTDGGTKIINRSAYFDGTNDYIDTGSDLTTLTGNAASLGFWIKTTQTGDTLAWSSPGMTGVENSGTTDDIFWGWLDTGGHIGITVGNSPDIKSSVAINDNIWHHIVITRNAADGSATIYVDGSLSASGTLSTVALNASFHTLGRIKDGEYFVGYLDEVEIYDTVLTQSEVTAIYNNELAGDNWDGSTRPPAADCSVINIDSTLVADYRLDECGFDGTSGDVIDNTINCLNGTTRYGTTDTTGKICKAALFDGSNDEIQVPDNDKFDFDPAVGFTVSAWVYVTADDEGVYVSKMSGTGTDNNDDGWDLELYNGSIYFDINGWDGYAGSAKPSANEWHHIVGVFDRDASREIRLYIDGSRVARENYNTTFRNATSDDLTIGSGGVNGYQEYYDGAIDEVKLWSRPLSATEISDMYTNENVGRNWNNATDARVCNTCQCIARPGSNMVSLNADFRNMSSGKDVDTMLSPDFGVNYGPSGDWYMARRDYDIVTDNNNHSWYTPLTLQDDLEFGKGYWIKNATTANVNYSCNLKAINFDATITDYPACQSANGKCILVDLVEPNGTNNGGPYIYTLTSFPISKKIRWDKVRVFIDGTAYPIDSAPARTLNPTIWRYDGDGNNYTNITPGIPGQDYEIDPCQGYWVELDANAAGKDVKLLIPQE